MSTYLQRLYDAAGHAAAMVDVRPAQRSSSPLLAVDQRLATPMYATSFLMGLPGERDLQQVPESEVDTLMVPHSVHREPVSPPDQASEQVAKPRTIRRGIVPPAAEEQITPPQQQNKQPGSPLIPVPPEEFAAVLADPPAPTGSQPPVGGLIRPTRDVLPSQTVTESRPQRHGQADLAPTQRGPRPEAVPPLPGPAPTDLPRGLPEVTRPATRMMPPTRPTDDPPRLRPARATPLEPLPTPVGPGATALDQQVSRMVREAMARAAPAKPAPRQETTPDSDTPVPGMRQGTAEAISVIGPLDRPARATTLYGLRLR